MARARARTRRLRTSRKQRGGNTLATLKATPTIINPDSKFVIVTYWWGRGRLNGNTGRPCPAVKKEILEAGDMLGASPEEQLAYLRTQVSPDAWKEPILFEDMIAEWEKSCIAANCNYMAVECPEFAQPGGYQLAINAKPLFIKKALELCYPRGVVYIDGDMTVNQYPGVFDMPGVDFAARSWNMDPRSSYMAKPLKRMQPSEVARLVRRKGRQYREELVDKFGNNIRVATAQEVIDALSDVIIDNKVSGAEIESMTVRQFANKYKYYRRIGLVALEAVKAQASSGTICFDPYVFETSGGIMFFGQSGAARWLLDTWAATAAMKIHAGKADDRVLSLIFQQAYAFLNVNFVALPIEYLWLTDRYALYMYEPMNYKISDIVFEHPACLTTEEMAVEQGAATSREPEFYEKFVSEEVECERPGGILDEATYFPDAKYGATFGPWLSYLDGTVQQPVDVILREEPSGATGVVTPAPTGRMVTVSGLQEAKEALKRGDDVTLGAQATLGAEGTTATLRAEGTTATLPPAYKKALDSPMRYELIATNMSEEEYWPEFDITAPIIMRAGNSVLLDMLDLCETTADLTDAFNASFVYLHRIRCAWV